MKLKDVLSYVALFTSILILLLIVIKDSPENKEKVKINSIVRIDK